MGSIKMCHHPSFLRKTKVRPRGDKENKKPPIRTLLLIYSVPVLGFNIAFHIKMVIR
jgi:hypothetical protein